MRQINEKQEAYIFDASKISIIHTGIHNRLSSYRKAALRHQQHLVGCRKHQNPLPIMIGHAVIDVATAGQILATSVIPGFYEMMLAHA